MLNGVLCMIGFCILVLIYYFNLLWYLLRVFCVMFVMYLWILIMGNLYWNMLVVVFFDEKVIYYGKNVLCGYI